MTTPAQVVMLPRAVAITEFAERLSASGEAVREAGVRVLEAWRPISAHYEAPEAIDLFVAMNPVEHETDEHALILAALARVLVDFAAAVHALELRPARLSDDLVAAELREAEDAAVAEIRAIDLLHYRVPQANAPSFALSGAAAWSAVLTAFDDGVESTPRGFLESLPRQSDLASWAAAHPRRLRSFLDSGVDAAVVREWWSGLDRSTRDALVAGVPLLVGNLDGVILADRAAANRLTIAAEITRLERDTAGLAAMPGYDSAYRPVSGSDAYAPSIAAHTALIASYRLLLDDPSALEMNDADGVRRRTNPPVVIAFDPARESFVHFLGHLDPETGELPATTKNVGVLVPGTMTRPAVWQADLFRAKNVLREIPEPSHTAIFTWAGGHFPQDVDAASSADSKVLGPKLAAFTNALRPTTEASLTGIGYSYGGAVLGRAEKTGIHLDASVSMAGAGLGSGVASVGDYPLTAGIPHYSMMAPGDHFVGHSQGLEAGSLGHGASPLDPRTGFIRLDTGFTDATAGSSSGVVTGHSAIWRSGSTPVRQVANILTGGPLIPFGSDG